MTIKTPNHLIMENNLEHMNARSKLHKSFHIRNTNFGCCNSLQQCNNYLEFVLNCQSYQFFGPNTHTSIYVVTRMELAKKLLFCLDKESSAPKGQLLKLGISYYKYKIDNESFVGIVD